MQRTEQIMGMPVTVICGDTQVAQSAIPMVMDFFRQVDERYSPYKETSEVSAINRGEIVAEHYSEELREILSLATDTKQQSDGYFDVWHNGVFDPSGIVKGWAIQEAARRLGEVTKDYYVEAGGDIQVSGNSPTGTPWRIGIRHPSDRTQNVAVLQLRDGGVATSGTAIRGQHIYNPHSQAPLDEIVSLTVVGPRIVDADRYATAGFAMGEQGIEFIAGLPDYEGYAINKDGIATMTPGWTKYTGETV